MLGFELRNNTVEMIVKRLLPVFVDIPIAFLHQPLEQFCQSTCPQPVVDSLQIYLLEEYIRKYTIRYISCIITYIQQIDYVVRIEIIEITIIRIRLALVSLG